MLTMFNIVYMSRWCF